MKKRKRNRLLAGAFLALSLAAFEGRPVISQATGQDLSALPEWQEAKGESNGWMKTGGNWSYLVDGVPVKGQMVIRNEWGEDKTYLFNEEGEMQTGWQLLYGNWMYFVEEYGEAKKGWLVQYDTWYFFDEKGILVQDAWIQDKGFFYRMDTYGAMEVSGWIEEVDGWRYVDAAGHRKMDGWLEWENAWYFLDEEGWMKTSGEEAGWTFDETGAAHRLFSRQDSEE